MTGWLVVFGVIAVAGVWLAVTLALELGALPWIALVLAGTLPGRRLIIGSLPQPRFPRIMRAGPPSFTPDEAKGA